MSKDFTFGKTKVAQVADEIREGKGDGEKKTPLVPTLPPANDEEPAQEEKEEPQQEQQPEVSHVDNTQEQQATPAKPVRQKQKKASDFDKVIEEAKVSKATNGIVVNVPLDDYMQLTLLKTLKKKTLKELALQAIHEFVERNKIM